MAARKTLDLARPDAGRSCAAMRGRPAATACASWSAGGDSQAAGAAAGVEELVVQRLDGGVDEGHQLRDGLPITARLGLLQNVYPLLQNPW